ncbi:hypothetical protein EPI10_016564 [Gossypium australe]|uniref:Uncharacterized protein n=1 Tax=Gossypium australe TaxID=47621 RepID=A0A5B6VP71_9ROSI|nr:hypothetical protein EPI10_016564 [Gossypium australe]
MFLGLLSLIKCQSPLFRIVIRGLYCNYGEIYRKLYVRSCILALSMVSLREYFRSLTLRSGIMFLSSKITRKNIYEIGDRVSLKVSPRRGFFDEIMQV